MKRLQAVIFDYGNVLSEPQRESDVHGMAQLCELDSTSFQTYYWKFREDYDRGDLDAEQYWANIAQESGRAFTQHQIERVIDLDCQSWSHPNRRMLEWVSQLRQFGLRTAILSNMPLALRSYIDDKCDWVRPFEPRIYSCDVQSIKPDARIYEACLESLNLRPEETLFLDDKEPNVLGARKLGINSCLFTSLQNIVEEVTSNFIIPSPLTV